MPYLQLNTSVSLSESEKKALFDEIGELMPLIPGKSRQNTMMHFIGGQTMELGDAEPCLYLEVRLYKPAPYENKQAFTSQICALLEKKLGVQQSRMYVNLVEMQEWGSGGQYKA